MNDELLFERLASHEEPAALDRAFEDRLYSILEREMRRGRSLRPALLLAATLVLVLTITAAIAIGSGLIKPPWLDPSLVPTPSASTSPRATEAPTLGMIEFRTQHTATLLPDGTVLVVGGAEPQFPSADVASAEVYDPMRRTWTATVDMVTPRYAHTATLLPDGTVLVVGGIDSIIYGGGSSKLASAELYDPTGGTWTSTGRMIDVRYGHTATLLGDGRVLVAGGYDPFGSGGSLASAELYDPTSGTWTPTGNMNEPSGLHTATLLLDGTVLVAGFTSFAELYDPRTGTWTTTGNMVEPRDLHTATLLLDGKVLVVGGDPGRSAELYDPSTGQWSATGTTLQVRMGHTATLLPDGSVLVAGGAPSVLLYDPASTSWTYPGDLVTIRHDHTATLLPDGTVLIAGGLVRGTSSDDTPMDWMEIYDPAPRS